VFCDPSIADGSQIRSVIASAPGRDERDDGSGNAQTDDDPHRVHDPSRLSATVTLVVMSTPFVPDELRSRRSIAVKRDRGAGL
jgi:hypothetical protein